VRKKKGGKESRIYPGEVFLAEVAVDVKSRRSKRKNKAESRRKLASYHVKGSEESLLKSMHKRRGQTSRGGKGKKEMDVEV